MNEVADVELPTQENVQSDLRSLFQGAVRTALEIALEEVLRDMVGARRWERLGQRLDHRNGTYLRQIMTSMGTIQVSMSSGGRSHP
jgi:transposase-like protein